MTTYWNNKTEVILLAVLIIFLGVIHIQRASSGPGLYTDSQHGDSTSGVDRSSIDAAYSIYAKGNCAHCHEKHASLGGSEPIPKTGVGLGPDAACLFSEEEGVCETCHDGSPVLRNILTQRLKTYHHPISEYSGLHTLSKLEYGQSGAPFRGSLRHAECCDCHEPHYIGDPGTTHIYNTTTPANNNLVSNPIKGVWGVEPTSAPLWSPPTTFTEQKTVAVGAAKEYQICYKCHSYYALQDADGITTLTGPSEGLITDQAMEFSPGNKSAHPVMVTLNNQTGSYADKALTTDPAQVSAPWTNVGSQTMYCCDCHGADNETSGGAKGPHGSARKYMLKGTGQYWPTKPDGTLWQLNTTDAGNPDLFCKNCHPIYNPSTGLWNNAVHSHYCHTYGNFKPSGGVWMYYAPCVTCHSAIPHGNKRSRLIVYRSEPPPYTYQSGGVNYAAVTGFKKSSIANNYYAEGYCRTSSEVLGCGIDSDRHGSGSGFDP